VQIIAGFHSETPAADFVLGITPDGRIQRYDKRHPVPGLEDDFTQGHVSGWLGDGRAEEICKDMDFPDTIRSDAAKGVRLMGVPAGDMGIDGWQHGIMSVMRGVEGGFSIVRAAHNGLVFGSDAQGRLVALKKDAGSSLSRLAQGCRPGGGDAQPCCLALKLTRKARSCALKIDQGIPTWTEAQPFLQVCHDDLDRLASVIAQECGVSVDTVAIASNQDKVVAASRQPIGVDCTNARRRVGDQRCAFRPCAYRWAKWVLHGCISAVLNSPATDWMRSAALETYAPPISVL